jgi:hypothetical protein
VKVVGKNKKTFSAKIINPASPTSGEGDPDGVNLNNFFSLMNKSGNRYIFSPCRGSTRTVRSN